MLMASKDENSIYSSSATPRSVCIVEVLFFIEVFPTSHNFQIAENYLWIYMYEFLREFILSSNLGQTTSSYIYEIEVRLE